MERGGDLVKPARDRDVRDKYNRLEDGKKWKKCEKNKPKERKEEERRKEKADLGGFQHVFWRHRALLCVPRMQVSLYLPSERVSSKEIHATCTKVPSFSIIFRCVSASSFHS